MTPDTHFISADAALDLVAELLVRHPIAAFRFDVHRGAGISIEIKRGAATVGCHLSVCLDSGRRVPVTAPRSTEIVDHFWRQTARVAITWSSTDRSVAHAIAALALYREVVELAALVEARLGDEIIGWSERAAVEAAQP